MSFVSGREFRRETAVWKWCPTASWQFAEIPKKALNFNQREIEKWSLPHLEPKKPVSSS